MPPERDARKNQTEPLRRLRCYASMSRRHASQHTRRAARRFAETRRCRHEPAITCSHSSVQRADAEARAAPRHTRYNRHTRCMLRVRGNASQPATCRNASQLRCVAAALLPDVDKPPQCRQSAARQRRMVRRRKRAVELMMSPLRAPLPGNADKRRAPCENPCY